MITIGLEGLRFHAFVGLYEEEKILGNEIIVDLYVSVSSDHDVFDSLNNTVDYETIFDTVKEVIGEKTELLEAVAKKILNRVSELSPRIEVIKVRVSKVHPPVTGRIDRVFVEEEWERGK